MVQFEQKLALDTGIDYQANTTLNNFDPYVY